MVCGMKHKIVCSPSALSSLLDNLTMCSCESITAKLQSNGLYIVEWEKDDIIVKELDDKQKE